MNLSIVFGNGQAQISSKITELKSRFDPLSIKEVDLKSQNLQDSFSAGLFSEKRLLILENADEKFDLTKITDDPNLTVIIKIFKNISPASVFLKEAVKLKAQIYSFNEKDEKNIFPFLDMLSAGDKRVFTTIEGKILDYGGLYILTMIYFMLRRLIAPSLKLPDFVVKKLNSQRTVFTDSKIMDFYRYVLETEYKIKTGLLDEKTGVLLVLNKITS